MIPDWLSAIGTLLAVLAALFIAIFQDWLRTIFSRPRLEVSISLNPPYCHKVVKYFTYPPLAPDNPLYGKQYQADCYYFRLQIKNNGDVRAEHVEVYAAELTKQVADGSFQLVETFTPMNLVWSHTSKAYLPAISPKMEKLCDLGHIIDPDKREVAFEDNNPNLTVPPNETTFSFEVETLSSTLGHVIEPGRYRLKLITGAANSKPIEKTLEINLTGKWYDDERKMLAEGISITILNSFAAWSSPSE
ncbi:MAG: hypothetical protein P8Z00_18145 [Anaerolineales bacterium]|jgi:hypothetical protein